MAPERLLTAPERLLTASEWIFWFHYVFCFALVQKSYRYHYYYVIVSLRLPSLLTAEHGIVTSVFLPDARDHLQWFH